MGLSLPNSWPLARKLVVYRLEGRSLENPADGILDTDPAAFLGPVPVEKARPQRKGLSQASPEQQ